MAPDVAGHHVVVSWADHDTIVHYVAAGARRVHAYVGADPSQPPMWGTWPTVTMHAAVLGPERCDAWVHPRTRRMDTYPPADLLDPEWHPTEMRPLRHALLAVGCPAWVHLAGPYAVATLQALPEWHRGRVRGALVLP